MEKMVKEMKKNKEQRMKEVKANKETLMKQTIEETGISENEMKQNGMFGILELMLNVKEQEALEQIEQEENEQMICLMDILNAMNIVQK